MPTVPAPAVVAARRTDDVERGARVARATCERGDPRTALLLTTTLLDDVTDARRAAVSTPDAATVALLVAARVWALARLGYVRDAFDASYRGLYSLEAAAGVPVQLALQSPRNHRVAEAAVSLLTVLGAALDANIPAADGPRAACTAQARELVDAYAFSPAPVTYFDSAALVDVWTRPSLCPDAEARHKLAAAVHGTPARALRDPDAAGIQPAVIRRGPACSGDARTSRLPERAVARE